MTEQELRALVRDAIARHAATGRRSAAGASQTRRRAPAARTRATRCSRCRLGTDTDGPCLIEPAVTCNHCGYCKSLRPLT